GRCRRAQRSLQFGSPAGRRKLSDDAMAQVGNGEGRIFLGLTLGHFFEAVESLGRTVGAASGRPASLAQSGLGAKRREQPRAGRAAADRPLSAGEAELRPYFSPARLR